MSTLSTFAVYRNFLESSLSTEEHLDYLNRLIQNLPTTRVKLKELCVVLTLTSIEPPSVAD